MNRPWQNKYKSTRMLGAAQRSIEVSCCMGFIDVGVGAAAPAGLGCVPVPLSQPD